MAINYEWQVGECKVYPTKSGKSNVVWNVHWKLTATDDTNKDSDGNNLIASSYGTQNLNTDDLSSFKNWSSLTNSDVQGWVETALTADTVTAMKASLDSNISQQITPSSVTKTLSG